MKWDSCRLTSWSRSHTSTTQCSIKPQRYKLTSVTSKHLSSSPRSDIDFSVSASRCSTDIQRPSQPVRRDLWPQTPSASQHDSRITAWGHRERYKHTSDRSGDLNLSHQISLISQVSSRQHCFSDQCCYY